MKSINLFFVVPVVILFFISGCIKNQNTDLEFKKMCQDSGYEWMHMTPTQDGKLIKDAEPCWGCMLEGIEHVCDKEKFIEYTKPK